ncbi:unnamed protein product [Parajaminaea phylloscopi]
MSPTDTACIDSRPGQDTSRNNSSSRSFQSTLVGSTTWSSNETSRSTLVDSSLDKADTSNPPSTRLGQIPLSSPPSPLRDHVKPAARAPNASTPQRPVRRANTLATPSKSGDRPALFCDPASAARSTYGSREDGGMLANNDARSNTPRRRAVTTSHGTGQPSTPSSRVSALHAQDDPSTPFEDPPARQRGHHRMSSTAPSVSSHSDVFASASPVCELDPLTVASSLRYHRASPTHTSLLEACNRLPCELCGALILNWAILLPCGHRACTACCCSGVNQVSTTPPRKHTCAACQTIVENISLSLPAAQAAQAAAAPDQGTPQHTGYCLPTSFDLYHANASGRPEPLSVFARRPAAANLRRLELGAAALRQSTPLKRPCKKRRSGDTPVHGGSPNAPLRRSSDGALNPDESLVLSEDASFYRPFQAASADVNVRRTSMSSAVDEDVVTTATARGQDIAPTPLPVDSTLFSSRAQLSQPPSCAPHGDTLAVVRVDNIPWTTGFQHVVDWVPEAYDILPDQLTVPQPVHIPLDLKSGKTANSGFIQVRNADCAKKLIRRRNNTKLQGRPVSLLLSSIDELRAEFFPAATKRPEGKSHLTSGYVTADNVGQLLHLMDFGAPQLKSPLKPIEFMVSLIQLLPHGVCAEEAHLLAQRCADVLGQGLHWSRSSVNRPIPGLLEALRRLLQACAASIAFTCGQKAYLLEYARVLPGPSAGQERTADGPSLGRAEQQDPHPVWAPAPDGDALGHASFYPWPGPPPIVATSQCDYPASHGHSPATNQCPPWYLHHPLYTSVQTSQTGEPKDWPPTPVSAVSPHGEFGLYPMLQPDEWPPVTLGSGAPNWGLCTDAAFNSLAGGPECHPLMRGSAAGPVAVYAPGVAGFKHMNVPQAVHTPSPSSFLPHGHMTYPVPYPTLAPMGMPPAHVDVANCFRPSMAGRGDPAFQQLIHSVAHRLADNDV